MKCHLTTKVAGVTFGNRQEWIGSLPSASKLSIVPEPLNTYDPNALAVVASHEDEVRVLGYVPRELAAVLAPRLIGQTVDVQLIAVTGGFDYENGERASLGLRISITYDDGHELQDAPF